MVVRGLQWATAARQLVVRVQEHGLGQAQGQGQGQALTAVPPLTVRTVTGAMTGVLRRPLPSPPLALSLG